MATTIKIAVDGPAGAGKSSISKMIAKELGFVYIDTGAMYRAVALKAINSNIDTKNSEKVISILDNIDIDMSYNMGELKVFLNGKEVTNQIRTNEVSMGASNVALIPEVRIKLVELQRQLAQNHNVIMDGRDIGTYVLPNADIKIFLTASCAERAKRRYNELTEKGIKCCFEDIKCDIEARDKNDSSRNFAPLKQAGDAKVIDTSHNNIYESFSIIINYIKEQMNIK